MKKWKIIYILAMVCSFVLVTVICFADTYYQKAGLFKINIPEGWQWKEDTDGDILITSPDGHNSIKIKKPYPIASEEEAKKKSDLFIQTMKNMTTSLMKATIVGEGERLIDDALATQVEFKYYIMWQVFRSGVIGFFGKGHVFAISFTCLEDEDQRLKIDQIIETFKFQ